MYCVLRVFSWNMNEREICFWVGICVSVAKCPLREITLPGNNSWRVTIDMLAVYAVAPSCWNHKLWYSTLHWHNFGDIEWPPRSPDLNTCDFFLWCYHKSKVYENRPRTAADLKQIIRNEVAAIPGVMLQRAMQNFRERLQECVNNNGQHLKDILFKKGPCYIKCFEINCIFIINSFSIMKYFLRNYNLKMIRYFCLTLYIANSVSICSIMQS